MSLEEMARVRDNQLRRQRARRQHIARANGQPHGLVDAAPIRQHVNRLIDAGWSMVAIAHLFDGGQTSNTQIRKIAIGETNRALARMDRLRSLPVTFRVPADMPSEAKVPATGAVRRVQGLLALGWTHETLAPHMGGFNTGRLLSSRNGPPTHISAANWHRVDRAFRRLSTTPGPSRRNRLRSQQLGHVPPAAWDDIDDPRERPKGVAA